MAGDNTTRAGRPALRTQDEARGLVLDVLREHADSLLRVARRHSLCLDDAQDAYQRAAEIFLRHASTLDADAAHRWLHTVVKHEAMRVRGGRTRAVSCEDVDLDRHEAHDLPDADEQLARFERLTRSAEALQRLKPQELRALWLRAQGHSYEEIAELCDWSYTKVNRCITEGRRSFLNRFAAIGSGAECRRWEPVLSALVDGEASAADLAGVRPHLRNCPACRAHVRTLRESTAGLAVLLPLPAVVVIAPPPHGVLARFTEALATTVQDRIALSALKLQNGIEAALPGKLAVVAASAAAVAGGGVAVQQAVTAARPLPARSAAKAQHPRAAAPSAAGTSAGTSRPPADTSRPAPARAAPRPHRARRDTAASEFVGTAAPTAAPATAGREFTPTPTPAPTATAASATPGAGAPIRASPGASRAERTAAAEFGGG